MEQGPWPRDEAGDIMGGWRHWREFWRVEGREAFHRYVDRQGGEEPPVVE
jgi:hypothetical protein